MNHLNDDLCGTGSVVVDGQRITVDYSLEVIEDAAGLRQIQGRIDVLGNWTLLYNIVAAPLPLMLYIADGRRVDIVIVNEGEALGSAYIGGRARFR